ncbi:MAG: ice-binding family protein [Chloroflexota bacterium]|nr:ice-binding family protein [Chloroflexota bacterium]
MKASLRSKVILTLITVVLLTSAIAVALASPLGHSHAAASAPPLGTAASFAVLGATTVTNTGPTVVHGDLGVSPGTSCTGFPAPCTGGPGVVTGTIHAGDPVAAQAQTDAHTAYANAAGQTCTTNLTGQNLGGLTLTPGVYCFSSSAFLTGTLTLDGQGNPNSVFIFQIGSTLVTAVVSHVTLINGASACNVFWQVGSSATLGTGTSFAGNILALTSITATTSATSNGSLYALNGAVTLDTNDISTCKGVNPPPPTVGFTKIEGKKVSISHFDPNKLSCTAPCTITIRDKSQFRQSVTRNGSVLFTLHTGQSRSITLTTPGTYVYGLLSNHRASLMVTVS